MLSGVDRGSSSNCANGSPGAAWTRKKVIVVVNQTITRPWTRRFRRKIAIGAKILLRRAACSGSAVLRAAAACFVLVPRAGRGLTFTGSDYSANRYLQRPSQPPDG